MSVLKVAIMSLPLALLMGCSDSKNYETAYCALVDISGTYAHEKANVAKVVKSGILPEMTSGDSLFVFAIDSNSYTEDNLISKVTLDYRPTQANKQKLSLSKSIDEFAASEASSQLTDVSGAMMLCADYLKATESGTKMMFVFSDMREELPSNVVRSFDNDEFTGIDIAAMNIIKLNSDSANPEVYRSRLADWERNTLAAGASSWQTLLDASKIPEFIQANKR